VVDEITVLPVGNGQAPAVAVRPVSDSELLGVRFKKCSTSRVR